jgi:hypothetical protein
MTNQPRILNLLDLGDGLPPIACNSPQEAAFFADLWLGYHGDPDALARLRMKYPPRSIDEVRTGR